MIGPFESIFGKPLLRPPWSTLVDSFLFAVHVLFSANWRDPARAGVFLKLHARTALDYQRLSNLYERTMEVERRQIPGALVECGVWRGGTSALIAFVSRRAGSRRPIWLFDSFEGLPEPTLKDGSWGTLLAPGRSSGQLQPIGKMFATEQEAESTMSAVLAGDLSDVHIVKGWFQDTLPQYRADIGPIALLHLDGDWYESIKCSLEQLYDRVSPGGIIVVDDYQDWSGCQEAVDEFLDSRDATLPRIRVGAHAAYFCKPLAAEPAAD